MTVTNASHTSAVSTDLNVADTIPSTLSKKATSEALGEISAATTRPIAAAYYPDWVSGTHPPQYLDFSKFDMLMFAFATPNSSSTLNWDSGATSTLQTLVNSAHSSGHNTKIVLSIGGWGGSYWFSQAVGSSSNVNTFVNACVDAVNTYNLDGIDIDWEYPGQPGAGNPNSPSDSANLLKFFTLLRSRLGWGKIISAAVPDVPWQGSNGSPLTNVSGFAAQMSHANIMNYDVFGSSASAPGPNAPLGNLCGNATLPQYSAEAAVSQWSAAGFPVSQLMLGLPLYGHVSQSSRTELTDIALPPPGFNLDAYRQRVLKLPARALACPIPGKEECGSGSGEAAKGKPNAMMGAHPREKPREDKANKAAATGDLSSYWGQQIAFSQIVALGALQQTAQGTFVQANGYTLGWDNCSDTPYLFNVSRNTVVTYDDTYSLGDKAAYAKQAGLAGCFTWSLDQDYGYVLQDVIRSNLGLS